MHPSEARVRLIVQLAHPSFLSSGMVSVVLTLIVLQDGDGQVQHASCSYSRPLVHVPFTGTVDLKMD